ncbi:MAG: phage portal protein [Acidimicrobiales bacterium]
MPLIRRFAEQRATLENPSIPLTAKNYTDWFGAPPVHAGVTVNEQTAMGLIAVYRCVELIAGTCAALPLKAYRSGTRERASAPVLDDPHPDLTAFEVWETGFASLLLWGNAYFRKVRDGTRRVRYLWPIHPSAVKVDLIEPSAGNLGGKVFAVTERDGERRPHTSFDILHIPGLGYDGRVGLSRIQVARNALGVGIAAEEYAGRFFGSGTHMSGIVTAETNVTQEQSEAIKQRWREKVSGLSKAHEVAVLGGGAKFQPISIPAKDAELLASRQYTTTEVARLFGLPPHAIGDVEKSTSWGTGIEQQKIGMVQFTLQPSYLTRVEQRVTKEVLLNPDVYAEYTIEGLLRGDAAARASFYEAMVRIRAMNPNEVRARENLEPYDGGDEFINPAIEQAPEPADDSDDDPGGDDT